MVVFLKHYEPGWVLKLVTILMVRIEHYLKN